MRYYNIFSQQIAIERINFMPNIFFQQLYYLYPNTDDFN